MPLERASIEFSVFDENGLEISYDRRDKKLIFEGWFNYIEAMDKFEITLEDLLKALGIPIEDIRNAYSIDCWGKKTGKTNKKKAPYTYKKKTVELFKHHRMERRPTYDLVCQWKECGQTFTTTDPKRKYCCQKCVNDWFKWQGETGIGVEKSKATKARRKEINKKISEGVKRKKNEL